MEAARRRQEVAAYREGLTSLLPSTRVLVEEGLRLTNRSSCEYRSGDHAGERTGAGRLDGGC
jgi:hypothetical protein